MKEEILHKYKELWDYYKHFLYTNKLDKVGHIDKVLETYRVSKLNHEKTENLYRAIISKEIESIIKNLSTNKSTGPNNLTSKFY